jgi:hypothetical protein
VVVLTGTEGPALLIHHDGDESSQLTATASTWPQVSIEDRGIHTLADIVYWSAQDTNSTPFNFAVEAGDDARLPLDCSRNPHALGRRRDHDPYANFPNRISLAHIYQRSIIAAPCVIVPGSIAAISAPKRPKLETQTYL